jgi:hypothetical protein
MVSGLYWVQSTNCSQDDQGSWHRRTCQRVSHRTCIVDGRHLHRIRLRALGIPLPHLHIAGIQLGRRLHACGGRLCVPDRPADLQHLHHTAVQRHRHDLRCHGVGPGGTDEGAPGLVPSHDRRVPSRPTGDSRLRLESTVEKRMNAHETEETASARVVVFCSP